MAEVTSKEVGRKASRLLKRRTLSDADLADVKAVAASALTQRGVEVKTRPALAAYLRITAMVQDPRIPAALQRRLIDELEKVVAPIAPAKP